MYKRQLLIFLKATFPSSAYLEANLQRRKEFCKLASKYAEEGKVALRNIRRDAVDKEKKDEKDGLISIYESRDNQSEIQKITDKYIALIETKLSEKEKEILKVW